MAIGRHLPQFAENTDLPKAIRIGFDEVFTALEESFCDLQDGHVSAFPIRHRNNIAWLVMHTLQSLDEYGNQVLGAEEITGKFKPVLKHEYRYGLWNCTPEEKPSSNDRFPGVDELLAHLAIRSRRCYPRSRKSNSPEASVTGTARPTPPCARPGMRWRTFARSGSCGARLASPTGSGGRSSTGPDCLPEFTEGEGGRAKRAGQ